MKIIKIIYHNSNIKINDESIDILKSNTFIITKSHNN